MHVDAEPAVGDVADDRGDRAERRTLIASGEPAHGHSHQRVPLVTDADRNVGGPSPRLRLTRSREARRR
jgi:hypothetical protein